MRNLFLLSLIKRPGELREINNSLNKANSVQKLLFGLDS
jgi:hypothetical protein